MAPVSCPGTHPGVVPDSLIRHVAFRSLLPPIPFLLTILEPTMTHMQCTGHCDSPKGQPFSSIHAKFRGSPDTVHAHQQLYSHPVPDYDGPTRSPAVYPALSTSYLDAAPKDWGSAAVGAELLPSSRCGVCLTSLRELCPAGRWPGRFVAHAALGTG